WAERARTRARAAPTERVRGAPRSHYSRPTAPLRRHVLDLLRERKALPARTGQGLVHVRLVLEGPPLCRVQGRAMVRAFRQVRARGAGGGHRAIRADAEHDGRCGPTAL